MDQRPGFQAEQRSGAEEQRLQAQRHGIVKSDGPCARKTRMMKPLGNDPQVIPDGVGRRRRRQGVEEVEQAEGNKREIEPTEFERRLAQAPTPADQSGGEAHSRCGVQPAAAYPQNRQKDIAEERRANGEVDGAGQPTILW